MEGKRRAMIFDADNTLYQTRKIAKQADMAAMRVFATQCKSTPGSLYVQFREIVRLLVKSRQPYQRTRQHSYGLLAAKHSIAQRYVQSAYQAFMRAVLHRLRPMPHLLPFLRATKRQGFRMGVVTEDRQGLAKAKLRKLKLSRFFSAIITADDVGTMKPNRKYIDFALRRLKVQPEDCMVFGDDFEKDLSYAKQRGAFTILIGVKDKRADKCVQSYAGLRKYIR